MDGLRLDVINSKYSKLTVNYRKYEQLKIENAAIALTDDLKEVVNGIYEPFILLVDGIYPLFVSYLIGYWALDFYDVIAVRIDRCFNYTVLISNDKEYDIGDVIDTPIV